MHGKRAIVAVSLAIGLLLTGSLACAPDTIDDDDALLPAVDLTFHEPGFEVVVVRGPELSPTKWLGHVTSTGREFSASIFHPPIA